jgi:hypothetical protein
MAGKPVLLAPPADRNNTGPITIRGKPPLAAAIAGAHKSGNQELSRAMRA